MPKSRFERLLIKLSMWLGLVAVVVVLHAKEGVTVQGAVAAGQILLPAPSNHLIPPKSATIYLVEKRVLIERLTKALASRQLAIEENEKAISKLRQGLSESADTFLNLESSAEEHRAADELMISQRQALSLAEGNREALFRQVFDEVGEPESVASAKADAAGNFKLTVPPNADGFCLFACVKHTFLGQEEVYAWVITDLAKLSSLLLLPENSYKLSSVSLESARMGLAAK